MWAVTAVATVVGSTLYTAHKADKAQERARKDAKQDRADALRAEQFAETEGEGQGSIGSISLAVEERVDNDLLTGDSNISL